MKDILFKGTSYKDICALPKDARRKIGYELYNVQLGENPSDWKPIPEIGQGAREIRIHSGNEYRVIYVTQFKNTIYVLHAFLKKTQKTPKKDIELAKQRYQAIKKEQQKCAQQKKHLKIYSKI